MLGVVVYGCDLLCVVVFVFAFAFVFVFVVGAAAVVFFCLLLLLAAISEVCTFRSEDFVANNSIFKEFAADVAMQVAANDDVAYMTVDDVPASEQEHFGMDLILHAMR